MLEAISVHKVMKYIHACKNSQELFIQSYHVFLRKYQLADYWKMVIS